MAKKSYGAEEARTLLPQLLEEAHHGKTSLITKRGKPYAAIVPADAVASDKPRVPLLSLEGTGQGLWGRSSAGTVDRLRDEWS
jgi:prevent-host-death family protein